MFGDLIAMAAISTRPRKKQAFQTQRLLDWAKARREVAYCLRRNCRLQTKLSLQIA